MKIYVSSAVGWANTELSAFDKALIDTGVANYNLIRLSSVIPPGSEIEVVDGKVPHQPGTWGDRLYVVYAEMRASVPGNQAWAGVGWVQDPTTKQGLFVEHEGDTEEYVRESIALSLKDLMRNRGMDELEIQSVVVGGVCQDHPICAFAVASYQVSDWQNQAYLQ